MRVLALDISTHTGWAVFDGEPAKLEKYGLIELKEGLKEEVYPWTLYERAYKIAHLLHELFCEHDPDTVVVEETNVSGKSGRYTQKLLEYIHCSLMAALNVSRKVHKKRFSVVYISTSAWRSALDVTISKEDKKKNARLSKAIRDAKQAGTKLDKKKLGIRGKVTRKHASILSANKIFGTDFKMKSNDIAEACLLGWAYLNNAKLCDGK